MRKGERQHRIEAAREFVAIAAVGISIGAGLMLLVPRPMMTFAGLENADQTVAAIIAFIAALIWLAARSNVTVR